MFDPFYATVAAQTLLTLAVLCLAAAGQEHFAFPKLLLVTVGLTVVCAALQQMLAPRLGPFHLVFQAAVALYVMHDVCWLTWRRAGLYAVILGVATAGVGFGVARLCGRGQTASGLSASAHPAPATPATQTNGALACTSQPSPPAIPAFGSSADWADARRALRVEGKLSYSDHAYVLVNERVYMRGQTVSQVHGGSNYIWQVVIDGSNSVLLQPLDRHAVGH